MCTNAIINCENLDESINSLCIIYGIDKKSIVNELKIVNIDEIYADAKSAEEFHFYMCKKFNVIPNKIDKIYWFHFSKSLDIYNYYKQGILPTDKILPKLMDDCYTLLDNKFRKNKQSKKRRLKNKWMKKIWSKRKWRKIWNSAIKNLPINDKIKFEGLRKDFGPNGMLVKDVGLYPTQSSTGHFLDKPEIVEGILRCIDNKYATNLMCKFLKNGTSCVVTFVSDIDRDIKYISTPILSYAYHRLHYPDICGGNTNYDAKNNIISKNRIIKVEIISFDDNGKTILTTVDNNFVKNQ